MKTKTLKVIAMLLAVITILSSSSLYLTANAWNAAPASAVDMSLKLVGMMNMKIYQDSPYIANVSTVSSGELSGTTLYAYKFSGIGTSIGKNWPHQVGDGPYNDADLPVLFGGDCIQECMDINKEETAVYMLYDLGDPNSQEVKQNMNSLGITDINEYYNLMSKEAKISISAYAGGGTAHETAITAYYRYSDDWRSFATTNSGKYIPRDTLLDMGIAAPNENRYFFETQESQKRLDGSDAFPGVFDESVQQYIDHKQSYSLPVWEDENEDASWNIINPVPTCNIYSRWGTNFDKDTTYDEIKAIKDSVVSEKYGDDYTDGQWYGYTDDQVKYYDGLDIDDMIVPKNWEWKAMPYYSTKSGTTYSATTAYKSHLGYGEYCPAATTTYHDFYLPKNQVEDNQIGRFMTVMVRETGTMCGLDGAGHWHSVKVSGVSTSNIVRFQPEINDDYAVIDYGLSSSIDIDANDRVWTTDALDSTAFPGIKSVKITAGNINNEAEYTTGKVYGKYGTLEITNWDNLWGDGHCTVKYTPKRIIDEPDVFYYKVEPIDAENYEPLYAKITFIPASIVYYEDNFSASDSADDNYSSSLIYSGNWQCIDSNGSEMQAITVDGMQQNINDNYGYDVYYENDFGYSNGSAHKSQKGDTLTFTFKGTGCDIIMRTDAEDGSVKYSATKNKILSDGSMSDESTQAVSLHSVSCRNNNENTLYQLPVISLRFDELAYYTVTVSGATSKPVYIDGIRLYNPLGLYSDTDSDKETMDEYYNTYEKVAVATPVYQVVYNANESDAIVGFIGMYNNWNEWYGTEKNIEGEEADFLALLTIGPNNEIYLAPGQSLVFNVKNSDLKNLLFAVEAKTLSANGTKMVICTEGSKASAQTINVNTNTAMYYKYDINNSGIGSSGTIKIQNNGPAILAISNLKYSKILTTSGKISYNFINEDGTPTSNVNVIVRNNKGETISEANTDSTGKFVLDGLAVGTYKVYITTPKGKSSIAARTVSVSETNSGDSARFALRDLDLEIGSAPEVWHSATVEMSKDGAAFHDYRTFSPAGSYTVTYTFDGTNTGYWNDKYHLNGTLTVIVNADGSASYNFVGSGKADRKTISSTSGTVTGASITNNELSVNYCNVLNAIFGTAVITDAEVMMPTGTSFYLQAYENANASIAGEYGEAAKVTIGEEAHVTSLEKATLNYTFTDEATGAPIAGVKVTVDGQTVVSGDDGKVTINNVTLGTQQVTFETPKGKSNVRPETHEFTPTDKEYSHTYELRDFDLTIGSHESVWHTPSVDLTSTTATIKDVKTFTDAGSYKVEYTFNGSTTGRVDGNNYLNGTLSIIINDDGTAKYEFVGSGKGGGKGLTSKSGTVSGASIDADGNLVINYISVWNTVTNSTGKLANVTSIMPEGTDFSITAYEYASADGEHGNTTIATIGAEPEITSEEKATLNYTFTDRDTGAPITGVKVTVDGQTVVSGDDGSVIIENVSLGNQIVAFETPNGKSNIPAETHVFTPDDHEYSHAYELYDFDLTIGSHPSIEYTPSVERTSTTATFENVRTFTNAGSYKIEYTFDGTTNGRVDKNNNLNGTLTVIVNNNGTAEYKFVGTGSAGGKAIGFKSGITSTAVSIDSTTGDVEIDYYTILGLVTGTTGKFTNMNSMMPDGTAFSVTAYEGENATGENGLTSQITVGSVFTSDVYGDMEGITLESDTVVSHNTPVQTTASFTSIFNTLITMLINFVRNFIRF